MADKAVKLMQSQLDLLRGDKPTIGRAQWETWYGTSLSDMPESKNKFKISNTLDALDRLKKGDIQGVNKILDHQVWYSTIPFTYGEDLTPEGTYRCGIAYSDLLMAGIASQVGHSSAERASLDLARSHFSWLLIGLGMSPGKEVKDHHLQHPDVPCVLIGTGAPVYPIRYVAQAGQRGWIRNREKRQPKVFIYIRHEDLSYIVYQGVGEQAHRKVRKNCRYETEMLQEIQRKWPALPVWGLSESNKVVARGYFNDPTSVGYARQVAQWLRSPSEPFTFIRFEDGSVCSLMNESHGSSTDTLMIDMHLANGTTIKTSADDGLRVPSHPQTGWETTNSVHCLRRDGVAPTMSINKPAVPIAYRVHSVPGQQPWVE